MKTRTKYTIVGVVIALGMSFAAGRYFTPDKIVIKEVEVVKEVIKKDTNTRTVRIVRPDGTKETTRVTDTTETTDRNIERVNSTETSSVKPQWKVSTMARTKIDFLPVYGAQIERRIIGPVFVGVHGWTDSSLGLSVGLEF